MYKYLSNHHFIRRYYVLKSKLSFIIIICFCASVFAGRAKFVMEKSDEKPKIEAKEDKAILVFMRIVSYGFMVFTDNYIDGKWIGQTKGKCYYITEIDPGTHYIMAGIDGYDTDDFVFEKLEFKAGHIYFLSQGIFPIRLTRVGLTIVTKTPAEFKEQLPELKYLVVDSNKKGADLEENVFQELKEKCDKKYTEKAENQKNFIEYKGYTEF